MSTTKKKPKKVLSVAKQVGSSEVRIREDGVIDEITIRDENRNVLFYMEQKQPDEYSGEVYQRDVHEASDTRRVRISVKGKVAVRPMLKSGSG
jgi:hypothetical protein